MTLTEELAEWASTLELDAVPERVVGYARSQVLSYLAAVRGSVGHPLGRRVIDGFGPPLQDDPAAAAYAMAALSMCLDWDDTLYAGHVSHSTVGVSLAYARARRLDGRGLLTTIIAANESAARFAAASTIGRFRGQSASHPHLFGAIAARLRAEGAPARRWVDAFGIGLGFPPWTLRPAFLGSDAKLFTAAVPVRMGLDACAAAGAGLRGYPAILEHEDGFLKHFSELPLPEAVVLGLGERWHTETLSFKLFPLSTGMTTCAECGFELHEQLNGSGPGDVEEILVETNVMTALIDQQVQPFLTGPDAPVVALQYAVSYALASALLRGRLEPEDFDEPAVGERERWALAEKIRVEQDDELTRLSIIGTAPVGEALRQAGDSAPEWVAKAGGNEAGEMVDGIGTPVATFEHADKSVGARVIVKLSDGRELRAERITATGDASDDTRARHAELLREKFLAAGGSDADADAVAALRDAAPDDVARLLESALAT